MEITDTKQGRKTKRPGKLACRFFLDLGMLLLWLFALGYQITGDVAHEWIGLTVLLVFIAHNILNGWWFQRFLSGRYSARRILNSAINILLMADIAIMIASGLFLSKYILGFMNLPGSMLLRQIHTTSAYWGIVLSAVHLGMHWEMVLGYLLKRIKAPKRKWIPWSLRLAGVSMAVIGVWASFDREMGSKLFKGFSFDYWDADKPPFLFFSSVLCIMSLYSLITHYLRKLLTAGKKA